MKRRRLGNKLHRVPFGFKIVGAGIRSGLFLFKLRELFHPVNAFLVGGMDVFHGHLHAGMSRPFLNDRERNAGIGPAGERGVAEDVKSFSEPQKGELFFDLVETFPDVAEIVPFCLGPLDIVEIKKPFVSPGDLLE